MWVTPGRDPEIQGAAVIPSRGEAGLTTVIPSTVKEAERLSGWSTVQSNRKGGEPARGERE